MGRIVAAYAYRCGQRLAEIQLGDRAAWAREKGDFVWIGFQEPTEQDLRTLQHQFGLHELEVKRIWGQQSAYGVKSAYGVRPHRRSTVGRCPR